MAICVDCELEVSDSNIGKWDPPGVLPVPERRWRGRAAPARGGAGGAGKLPFLGKGLDKDNEAREKAEPGRVCGLGGKAMTADELDKILQGFEARIMQPKSEKELAEELEADARKLEVELARIFAPRGRVRGGRR